MPRLSIRSFGDPATADIFNGVTNARTRALPTDVIRVAVRKLDMLNAATTIQDLRSPKSNHLEELKGDLKGYYSIRVNKQWRIVFKWTDGAAVGVRIVDYH
jgi:proteic killer suppression protein